LQYPQTGIPSNAAVKGRGKTTMTADKSLDTVEDRLDDSLDDTFPASDPPSQTDPSHGVRSATIGPNEDVIRQRAYEIWQRAGSPDGVHDEHWEQARTELDQEDAG
jgi:hypothetical protein